MFMVVCSVLLFGTAGLIALVKFEGVYSTVGKTHTWFSIVVVVFISIQILGGAFRPAPSSHSRKIFNIVHGWLGRLLVLMTFMTIALGVAALQEKLLVSISAWVSCYSLGETAMVIS